MQALPPNSFPPVYLLEILAEPDGAIQHCDNFGRLENALEEALKHVRALGKEVEPEVEVAFDSANELEGVGIYNGSMQMLAYISVYHLDRDTDDAQDRTLQAACRGDLGGLQESLNRLLYA